MSMTQMVEAARERSSAAGPARPADSRGADQTADRQKFSLVRPPAAPKRPASDMDVLDLAKLKARPEEPAERNAGSIRAQNQNVALKLLDEVSSIVPVLVQENQALRLKLSIAKERAAVDIESARELACEWRRTAETSEQRVLVLEAKLKDVLERAERAEQVANAERELAMKSSQDAAEAECLSSLFEDKVLSSFGIGSLFQNAMDKIRNREAVEALS